MESTTQIIEQRKKIVARLNKRGYWARKFADSETGLLTYKRGDQNGPYARIVHDGKIWKFRCYGVSELINPMVVFAHIEKAIGLVDE